MMLLGCLSFTVQFDTIFFHIHLLKVENLSVLTLHDTTSLEANRGVTLAVKLRMDFLIKKTSSGLNFRNKIIFV